MGVAEGAGDIKDGLINVVLEALKAGITQNPIISLVIIAICVLIGWCLREVLKHKREMERIRGKNKVDFEKARALHRQHEALANQTKALEHQVEAQRDLFEQKQPALLPFDEAGEKR